jgi:hypothetical protein
MQHLTIEFPTTQPSTGAFFVVGSLYDSFTRLTDKRKARGRRYPLATVLVMTLLAKLAGEDEPQGIAHWLALRKEFLLEALALKRPQTPHAVTFSRVLGNAIEVEELEQAMQEFFCADLHLGALTAVSMDGKVLRGSIHRRRRGRQLRPDAGSARSLECFDQTSVRAAHHRKSG